MPSLPTLIMARHGECSYNFGEGDGAEIYSLR